MQELYRAVLEQRRPVATTASLVWAAHRILCRHQWVRNCPRLRWEDSLVSESSEEWSAKAVRQKRETRRYFQRDTAINGLVQLAAKRRKALAKQVTATAGMEATRQEATSAASITHSLGEAGAPCRCA